MPILYSPASFLYPKGSRITNKQSSCQFLYVHCIRTQRSLKVTAFTYCPHEAVARFCVHMIHTVGWFSSSSTVLYGVY